jgi:hypothetical protein
MSRIPGQLLVLAACCAALSASPAGLHAQDRAGEKKPDAPGVSSPADKGFPQKIIDELWDRRVWVVVLVAFVFGAMGSFAYELAEARSPKPPPPAPSPPDRGFWFRVLLGGFAAVAVLYPLRPDGLIGLIGLSVIAGSMGAALFKALQERVLLLARTARLSAAVEADRAMFRDIRQQAREGATQAAAALQDDRQPPAAGAVKLSVIAGLAEAGLRVSEGAVTAQPAPVEDGR